ncbi:hypothetical protein TNCV_2361151 [Trichonephila clavipes]|nr:hypothetical protein TNCV_2361151 [Trichonephila clavipes]
MGPFRRSSRNCGTTMPRKDNRSRYSDLRIATTDHLIGTSAHGPQRPMVTHTGMGTVGPSPHGLLSH